jgi:hypothetical protein
MEAAMAPPLNFPVLPGPKDLPADGADAGRQIKQAAELVSDFTRQTARPALDLALAAAEGPNFAAAAATLGGNADEIIRQTELLYDEVARFLTLSSDPGEDEGEG